MVINEYVKKWCDEDYDVRKEDFYAENAYYVAGREWANCGWKHGIFAVVASVVATIVGGKSGFDAILNVLMNIGIFSVCFWLYGIREYDANSIDTSVGIYLLTAIMLFIGKGKMPILIQIVFALATMALFVRLSILDPIKFRAIEAKMKQRIIQEEEEEEQASAARHAQWENGYKAYRYGLPEGEQYGNEDPDMKRARQMFDGYTDTKQMIKTRYRQLAKQYHPDRGGDTKFFQCIVAVYEELGGKTVT